MRLDEATQSQVFQVTSHSGSPTNLTKAGSKLLIELAKVQRHSLNRIHLDLTNS